jgi:hypothetical protein
MLRLILGVIIGLVSGYFVIFAVQQVGHQIWPVSVPLDPGDKAAAAAFMADMPFGALLTVVAAWSLGAYTASMAGLLVAHRRRIAGVIPAALIFAATVVVLFLLPHPLWMVIAGLGGIVAAAWVSDRLFALRPEA